MHALAEFAGWSVALAVLAAFAIILIGRWTMKRSD